MKNLMDNGFTTNDVKFRINFNFHRWYSCKVLYQTEQLFSGYHGCDQCTQEGTYDERITYTEIECRARWVESFSQRDFPAHHVGVRPLEQVNIGIAGVKEKDDNTLDQYSIIELHIQQSVATYFYVLEHSIDELQY